MTGEQTNLFNKLSINLGVNKLSICAYIDGKLMKKIETYVNGTGNLNDATALTRCSVAAFKFRC